MPQPREMRIYKKNEGMQLARKTANVKIETFEGNAKKHTH
jgi:hypothetical protein